MEVEIFSAPRSAVTVAPGTDLDCARNKRLRGRHEYGARNRESYENDEFNQALPTARLPASSRRLLRVSAYFVTAAVCVAVLVGATTPLGIWMACRVSLIFFKFAAWTSRAETKNLPVLFIG